MTGEGIDLSVSLIMNGFSPLGGHGPDGDTASPPSLWNNRWTGAAGRQMLSIQLSVDSTAWISTSWRRRGRFQMSRRAKSQNLAILGQGENQKASWRRVSAGVICLTCRYSTRVSPQFSNRMVEAARSVLNRYLPDIYLYTDVYKGEESGK